MPGFVHNPYAYMSRANVFVLSSRWEGLPNTILQALACGCPVVSTDCPSGPSEILDGGNYGALVPPGDAPAMAQAILATIENPPESESHARRVADYSMGPITGQYLGMLIRAHGSNQARAGWDEDASV